MNEKLERIKNLLRKAESTTYEPEREALQAKAEQLIAKYGIDEALLGDLTDPAQRPGVISREIILGAPYANEKAVLLNLIGHPLRVRLVQYGGNREKTLEVKIWGFEADIDRTLVLFESLVVQALHGVAAAANGLWFDSGPAKAAYRRSWLRGFSLAVGGRLEKAEKLAAQEAAQDGQRRGPSVALVLVSRSEEVDRAVTEVHPRLRATKKVVRSGDGIASGYRTGLEAHLDSKGVRGTTETRREVSS